MDLKGSRTENKLLESFVGESQVQNWYTFFTSVVKKEGYEQIVSLFQRIADNEWEHAGLFFKFLKGRIVEIQAVYPVGVIGVTSENLREVAG